MPPNPVHQQFCICICISDVKPPPNQVHHNWKVSLNKNLRLVAEMERVEIEVPSSNAHCAISFQTPSRHQLVFSSISSLSYTSSSSILLLIPSPGGRVDQIRGIFQGHPGPYCPVKFQSWVRPASALSISHSSKFSPKRKTEIRCCGSHQIVQPNIFFCVISMFSSWYPLDQIIIIIIWSDGTAARGPSQGTICGGGRDGAPKPVFNNVKKNFL